jgi:hypothetical protein
VEIADRLWQAIVTPVRAKLLALPADAASGLGLSDGQRRVLEAEIDDIIADLSKKPDYFVANA